VREGSGAAVRQLRPYQLRSVQETCNHLDEGRRVLVVAPPGAGKTTIGADIVRRRDLRTLWVAHRIELVSQAADRLAGEALRVGVVVGDACSDPAARIQCGTVQTLANEGRRPTGIGLVVLDECFAAGTLVEGRPIESIREGDVLSTGKVLRSFVRIPTELVRVTVGTRELVCTPNHPFWTKGSGYVQAINLLPGDLCCVQADVFGDEAFRGSHPDNVLQGLSFATDVHDNGAHKSNLRIGADDRAQSDAQGLGASQDGRVAPQDRSSAYGPRREREAASSGPAEACRGVTLGDGGTGFDRSKASRDRDVLQGGHRQSSPHDSDRGGRWEPSIDRETGPGSEEGTDLGFARVDGVEVLEPGSDGRFGGLCPDGRVYNLEVEGSHVYFAGGVLVHNCHHYAADEWRLVHEAYPGAELVGLTATPRAGMADIFSHLVVAATYSELVADGHLCPCPPQNVLAPPPDATDYEIACHPLTAWQRFGQGRSTLAYCSSVAQAEKWHAEFRAAGVSSSVLHAKSRGRAAILRDFQEGRLRVIWSVGILTEGTDLPICGCVLLARACEDQGTFLQITGRGLRPHPSKRDLVLIDLVGATLRHGYPAEDRFYSLYESQPIRRTTPEPLRQCLACGHTIAAYFRVCPDCGEKYGPKGKRAPKIYDLELAAVYEAENTPKDAKRRQLLRLIEFAKLNGHALSSVVIKYKAYFGEEPNVDEFRQDFATDEGSDQALYSQLIAQARAKGYKPGWAFFQFKRRRGYVPSRRLMAIAQAWVNSSSQQASPRDPGGARTGA
jgi:superfamily II DNA or RNA helicase